MPEALSFIADLLAALTFVGMFAFAAIYGFLYQWKQRKAGKSLLLLSVAFLGAGALAFFANWLPELYEPVKPVLRVLAWSLGLWSVVYLLYALIYNWRDRHKPVEPVESRSPRE